MIVGPADTDGTHGDGAGGDSAMGEPSLSSALERLGAASQGVITKRIDLALLEGQELLARSVRRAALVGGGMVLAAAAWFALAACIVLFVIPAATLIVRLAVFALLNGVAAVGVVALAMRRDTSRVPVRAHGRGTSTPAEP